VLGAGVIGVVTAWYLSQRGHAVTVIEKATSAAAGTSHANAGQLSYSFTDALANPAFLRRLPGLALGRDPGVLFRPRPSAAFLRWGSAFLAQCTPRRARDNTVAVLQLAMRSSQLLDRLLQAVPLEFSFARAGKLLLLTRSDEMANARRSIALKQEHGCTTELLTRSEALDIEPALADMRSDISGAIYSRNDHVADARLFTQGLADHLRRERTAEFRMGETVSRLVVEGNRVRRVVTDRGEYAVDAVVACLGTGSANLLRPLGIDPAVYPVRGYSLTFPPGRSAPAASVSDLKHRIVLSRLGESVRIAGFADFVDLETRYDEARQDDLLAVARRVAPLAADYDVQDMQRWAGFRPMTPDGRPRVGRTRIGGLFLNSGHGMLGWTLACATGDAVAQRVSEETSRR
jgi:D-amino-acid dehydrogenase